MQKSFDFGLHEDSSVDDSLREWWSNAGGDDDEPPFDGGVPYKHQRDYVLRPYQADCVNSVMDVLYRSDSALYVMPTGCGKTITFLEIAKRWLEEHDDQHVLILAHRQELIYQAARAWERVTGQKAGIEMADDSAWRLFREKQGKLICASKDSLNEARLRRICPDPNRVSMVIVDEVHHATKSNKSYRRAMDYFFSAKRLGVTATPDRADKMPLGDYFENVAYEYPLYDPSGGPSAISDGYLVPVYQHFVQIEGLELEDYERIAKSSGLKRSDYDADWLGEIMARHRNLLNLSVAVQQVGVGSPTIVFAPNVLHACQLTDQLNRQSSDCARCVVGGPVSGVPEGTIVWSADKRKSVLESYERGDFNVMVNVGCLTEGYDNPSVSVIVIGRPTKSRVLYSQMVGRGMRVLPGVIEGADERGVWTCDDAEERKRRIAESKKPRLVVYDVVGLNGMSLVRQMSVASLLFKDMTPDISESLERRINRKQDAPVDVANEYAQALKELQDKKSQEAERIAHAMRGMVVRAKVKLKQVDPFDVIGIDRKSDWLRKGSASVTPAQSLRLQKIGLDREQILKLNYNEARAFIETCDERRRNGLCTFKQARLLRKYGYDTKFMKFETASKIIGYYAENVWGKWGRKG